MISPGQGSSLFQNLNLQWCNLKLIDFLNFGLLFLLNLTLGWVFKASYVCCCMLCWWTGSQNSWAVLFIKPLPQITGFTQWRCPSVCLFVFLFVRLSPMLTDGGGGLLHWPFGPHCIVSLAITSLSIILQHLKRSRCVWKRWGIDRIFSRKKYKQSAFPFFLFYCR